MGLFQKKPDVSSSLPLYRIESGSPILIIGLGNTGREYKNTRHNTGFMVVDQFAKLNDFSEWQVVNRLKSMVALGRLGGKLVILAKPLTLMNESGQSAALLQRFYKAGNHNTLVVYDELALQFGQLRTRQGGSDAGHNGIKSLTDHIGDDYNRLRIGIAKDHKIQSASSYVLGKFTKEEQAVLIDISQEACAMLVEYIFSGELPRDTRTVL